MEIAGSKNAARGVLVLSCLVAAALLVPGVLEAAPALPAATLTSGTTDWQADLGWCNHPSGRLYIGDFNRDGRDDMLCHDTASGYKWVARAKGNGTFTGTDWQADLGWCNHPSGRVYIGDFNRDRRDDMLCHDVSTGHKWVALAKGNGTFTGTDWEADLGWCNHPSGQLHIGDFNGDRRDDMLCHDTATGYKWIAYAKGGGTFTGTDWQANLGWCNHPSGQLRIGDFNRDGRDDMLCHDTATGYKWIAYARANGGFTGTDWQADLGWCNHPSGQLHVGDFNRDDRDDLLCHDTSTGYKWVILSSLGN